MGFIFPFNPLVRLRRALSYRCQTLALILHSLEQDLSTKWPLTQVCTPLITSWNIHLRNRQRQHKNYIHEVHEVLSLNVHWCSIKLTLRSVLVRHVGVGGALFCSRYTVVKRDWCIGKRKTKTCYCSLETKALIKKRNFKFQTH